MKNRRIVAALLIIAILCVGVGFAATTENLNFTGKITYKTDVLQLVWGTVTDGIDLVSEFSGTNTDTFEVLIDTTEWNVGEAKSFVVTVENNSGYAATGVNVNSLVEATNYTVKAEIDKTDIAAGQTANVTITVTMKAYPTPTANATAVNDQFTFTVTGNQATN